MMTDHCLLLLPLVKLSSFTERKAGCYVTSTTHWVVCPHHSLSALRMSSLLSRQVPLSWRTGKITLHLHKISLYTVECLTFLVSKKFCRLIFIFGRKPYEISTLMNLYNLFQVVANVLLVYGYWTNGWSTYYNWCKYSSIKFQNYCLKHHTKQSQTNYFIQCVKAWILIPNQDLQATTWLLLPQGPTSPAMQTSQTRSSSSSGRSLAMSLHCRKAIYSIYERCCIMVDNFSRLSAQQSILQCLHSWFISGIPPFFYAAIRLDSNDLDPGWPSHPRWDLQLLRPHHHVQVRLQESGISAGPTIIFNHFILF